MEKQTAEEERINEGRRAAERGRKEYTKTTK